MTFEPSGPEFSGGSEFEPMPLPGADMKTWFRVPNITPQKGSAFMKFPDRATFVARFKVGGRQHPGTPMPWEAFARMSAEDVGAIYEFLRSLPPAEGATVRSPSRRQTSEDELQQPVLQLRRQVSRAARCARILQWVHSALKCVQIWCTHDGCRRAAVDSRRRRALADRAPPLQMVAAHVVCHRRRLRRSLYSARCFSLLATSLDASIRTRRHLRLTPLTFRQRSAQSSARPVEHGGTITMLNNGDQFVPALLDAIAQRGADDQLRGVHLVGRRHSAISCSPRW